MEVLVSKGFLILAQNTETVDYVQQAYALALSIKHTQHTISNVSLVTTDPVPEKYKSVFDNIIEIPWITPAETSRYKTEHRWKLYHVTPYDETIVLDSDMLMLEDISIWWDNCKNYDLQFCSKVNNYKLETITNNFYRKAFTENNLSNPYFALHYFKKTDPALEFYKTLEFVCNNWEWFYDKFASNEYQNWLSMDLATAITIEVMGLNETVVNSCSPLEFIHMKPGIQGWKPIPVSWQTTVPYVFNSKGNLVVGNIKQSKLFHYVEKDFLTSKIISRLEELVHGKD